MKNISLLLLFVLFNSFLHAQTPELRIPAAHECTLFGFSNDDQTLITGGNMEIKIWDMEGPYLLKSLKWPGMDTLYNQKILFSKANDRVCIYADGQLRFINMRTLEWENNKFTTPKGSNMALSPDGKHLYMLVTDGAVDKNNLLKIDLSTGLSSKLFDFGLKSRKNPNGIDAMHRMEISQDGNYLLSEGYERGGLLIDLKLNKVLKTFEPQLPMFFTKTGNLITSTYLSYDENNANVPNPKYLIEEVEMNTWKTLRKLTFSIQNDDQPDGNGIVWISDDHKNKILYENNRHFYVFDAQNWTISPRRQYTLGQTAGSSHFVYISDGGKYLYANSSMEAFSLETGALAKKTGFFPYLPFNLAQATLGEDRGILAGYKHLHFGTNGFRVSLLPVIDGARDYDYLQRSIYRLVPTQKKVLMVGGSSADNYRLKSYTLGADTSEVVDIEPDQGVQRNVMEIRAYEDHTVLVTDYDRFFSLDSRSWKQKQQVVFGDNYVISHFSRGDEGYILERSPTDRSRVIIHLKTDGEETEKHRIACFDLIQKRMVWSYDESAPLSNPVFAENGAQVWLINTSGQLVKLEAQTGKMLNKSAKIPYANEVSIISTSGKYLTNFINGDPTVFGTTQINVIDLGTLQLKFALKQQRVPYLGSMFFDNDRFFITQDEDLKIWNSATGKLIARIVLIEGGADWIVSAPDGRFDGSAGGLKQMYYVKGRDQIPLEQLYEGFYTPNLLHELMYGEGSSKSAAPVDFNNLKLPPSVRIVNKSNTGLRNLVVAEDNLPNYESVQKTVTLSVEADGKDDKIIEMRLYQNGKLITDGTRGFKPVVEGGSKSQRDFEVQLLPGENRFRAVAVNSQRTESRAEEILIQFKAAPDPKKDPGITLHMIVIGVNEYKNSKYNLNYAEADAQALRQQLQHNCGKVVSACKEYYILNGKAVKGGIVSALVQVSKEANPEDLFIFYYAGHGVMSENQAFYLVPHDVTQLYGNDGALAQKGISAQELKDYSTQIKAQKQVFILDACQSSGALQAFTSRGAAEEKAIAQLARSTGTHWLTAAGSEQFASEFTQLGHGVFTYVLLEGLQGGADRNGDNKITIKEMDAYLQDQVPALTEKYKGTPQYPSSYGFGQDFPVGIKQ